MALDDFFTLAEINDGLTAPRIMELVAVMQKERNCTADVGDAARQWSVVASAVAATESKDCLDLFIQLNGVQFIDRWLKQLQEFSNDTSLSTSQVWVTRETMIHVLRALEKLLINNEKLVASQVWGTVTDLLAHNSLYVQEKARILFESWKSKRESDASLSHIEKVVMLADNEKQKTELIQKCDVYSESSLRGDKEKGHELAGDDSVPSTGSDAFHSGKVEVACNLDKVMDSSVIDKTPSDHVGSPLSKLAIEPPKCQSMGTAMVESCIPTVSRQDKLDGPTKFSKLEQISDMKLTPSTENSPDKLGSPIDLNTSENRLISSTSFFAATNNSIAALSLPKESVAGDENSFGKSAFSINSKPIGSERKYNYEGSSCDNLPNSFFKVPQKVAMEVEEHSSSSKKLSGGMIGQQSSDSDGSTTPSSPQMNRNLEWTTPSSSHDSDGVLTNVTQDVETLQAIEAGKEEFNREKGLRKLELNQSFSLEDINTPRKQVLTPVSIAKTSREAVASVLPESPLHFEVNHGWKSSLATELTLRIHDNNKVFSAEGSSNNSKQPRGIPELYLNVTESEDGSWGNLSRHKQVPFFSSLGSWESSVEMDSRKSKHLDLELNLAIEDSGTPLNQQIGQLLPLGNDHQSWSRSSSMSYKQPYLNNFDQNDQPIFLGGSSDNFYLGNFSQNFDVSRDMETEDSEILLMGTKVKVNRQRKISLPNARTPYVTSDVDIGRKGSYLGTDHVLPYSHSSSHGNTSITPGSDLPVYSTIDELCQCVPITCVATPSNGVGHSWRSGRDKDGSKDPDVFSPPRASRLMEDQLRFGTVPSVGEKRKEPDDGLEN